MRTAVFRQDAALKVSHFAILCNQHPPLKAETKNAAEIARYSALPVP